jgi:glycosyltransferase involved in cell wall biosynthesis
VLVENEAMVAAATEAGQRNVVKAPPGVDTTRFLPAFDGWRKDGHLLSVCRLGDPRKGLDRLIRAYAVLCREAEPAPRLVIAGKGRLLPAHRELIEDLKLTQKIDVRTDVSEKALVELYQKASVFVQTSHEEGLGLSVLEAMACGLPVVTTVSGTNHEIVVPPNERVVDDPEALAEALVGLLEDPGRRAAVGAANRRHVERHHELGTQCARMGAAFAEVEAR